MNHTIQTWLESDAYQSQLKDTLSLIKQGASVAQTESETASVFEVNLYHLIRTNTGLIYRFGKETKVDEIRHIFSRSDKSTHGRLDAVVNQLVIEYKHHTKLVSSKQVEEATHQVEGYIAALFATQGQRYNAILTDGIHVRYFSCQDNGNIEYSSLLDMSIRDLDIIIKSIVCNNTKKLEAQNIKNDFSISANYDSISKKLAFSLYSLLKERKTEKTQMLFAEWMNLMHLSVQDDSGKGNDIAKRRKDLSLIFHDNIMDAYSEYQALYALQTTYAIIVKLLACRVVDKIEFNNHSTVFSDLTDLSSDELQVLLQKIEDGYSYRSNNISNFLEGDFFSWYSDPNQWDISLWQQIKETISIIEQYSTFALHIQYHPIDIFKDLYMGIVPKSIRHSMGEYFTPYWLADYVVSEGLKCIKKANWKAIDPCCGSGIFVHALIRHIVGNRSVIEMTAEEKEDIVRNITNRVYGVDINPLSVLSARVGYYLALLPFGKVKNVDIPIYLGDSAIIPQKVIIDTILCYKYSIANEKMPINVIFPESFVQSERFTQAMNDLQLIVNTGNAHILFESLLSYMPEEALGSMTIRENLQSLAETLNKLYVNQWDGIWVRIITNYMLIARLKEISLIVGNPPWVKWEHLPATYAKRIKETCDVQHIFSSDGGQYGGTQLNICALIANMTAKNWLDKEGILAFLMPDSIMSQNSYEGFRNFYTNHQKNERLYLQKLDKWETPLRPFRYEDTFVSQDFNTYYFAPAIVDYSPRHGVPVTVISRKSNCQDEIINKSDNFAEAKKHLTFSYSKAVQLSASTAFTYQSGSENFSVLIGESAYQYRTGVEFTPQELYMLRATEPSERMGFCRFTNKKFQRSKYIVDAPDKGWELPTEHIYPIVTSPDITPFHYKQNGEYAIIPYTYNDTKKPISEKELLLTQRDLYLYLSAHKSIIDQQSNKSKQMHRGEEFYALSKIGKYTFAPHIVAARDNTNFCASVVHPTMTTWGEQKSTICVKHTIIISMDTNNRCITEDEAYYICGILNSTIVHKYIHASFKSNGISLKKSGLYLPLYNETNPLHTEIVTIAKAASTHFLTDAEEKQISDKLSTLYIDICNNRTNNRKTQQRT